MTIEILTPEKRIYAGETTLVQLPGESGLFELLDNHAPIISSLKNGVLKFKDGNDVKRVKINSGFVECLKNKVVVLVEGAEILS
jgi:F-type H+-transporting ATPase subunit epsilon